MFPKLKPAALSLALLFALSLPARAEEAPGDAFVGDFDPEESCDGPVSNPVCAYKTWFFCRVADQMDMCDLVLGKGPEKDWDDKPWQLALSDLISGPLGIYGYAFAGAHKVAADRFGAGQDRLKQRLIGAYELRDTYADPDDKSVAYVGSEFYAQTKSGTWKLLGWTLDIEGGKGNIACDDASVRREEICKLRIQGLASWTDYLRAHTH